MYEVAIIYLCIAALLIFGDWRRGLPIVVLTTIIQDPLRKLTPDQPLVFTLMVGVVVVVTFLASLARASSGSDAEHLRGYYRRLVISSGVFVAIIALQTLNGVISHGSLIAVALGVMTYFGPLPAILVGRHLAQTSGDRAILSFMKTYLIFAIPAVFTIALQYSGFDWTIFREVGPGLRIYDVLVNGAPVTTYQGVFRSSEIAAWHVTACCCFFVIVVTQQKVGARSLLFSLAVIGALLALGVLTGRRKLLIQVTVFLTSYVFLIGFVARTGIRVWLIVAIGAAVTWIVSLLLQSVVVSDTVYRQFLARGQSGFSDVGDRFSQLGLEPLVWAYNRFGPMGGGVGAATSGAQNYGLDPEMVAVGEGGLGKLAGELGWIGLAAAIWLGAVLTSYVLKNTSYIARSSPRAGRLRCGMTAFLIANFSAFSVATQVFNDLFVLTTLGLFIGALLSQSSLGAISSPSGGVIVGERPTLRRA